MSDLSMESVLGRPWLDESEKTEADQVFIADLSQPNLLSIRQTIHLTSTACTRWNVRKSILTAVYHWILRLYAAILYFWNEHLTLPRSWPSTLLATWTYSTSSHDVQGVSTETLQHLPAWLLRQGELQSCCFGPSTTFDVQVWTQIGIAMSTLNTVGMQSLKRLCISNQWNPKRSQQTQLQGIKCMVPFFQSQTFERRFPCYQDIWGTDFRTSGGANKTVTEICNQSGKALLTAHHVTRRFPKALHMTQATASMGIRLDSETTQMNTQKPKQEWKKITLSQSCLIFEDITTTRSRYHYYGSPGFQVVNDLIISGKTGEKFWCDVSFVEHCLQQRPRIQVLRTVVQARLSHRKHKPTIATLHCNMDMMSQVWNFQVIFHGEHVWSKPWTCNIAGQIWQPWLKSKHRFQV